MKTRTWILGLACGAFITGCPLFRTKQQEFNQKLNAYDAPAPRKAAQNALEIFAAIKDTSSLRLLGLKNHADAHEARLGDSLPKLDLECREILAYDSAKTPDFVSLRGRRDLLYRVQEDSAGMPRTRSFVTTRQLSSKDTSGKPGDWRPVEVGAAYYQGKIDASLESQVPPGSRQGAMVIEAPALNQVFIGYEAEGRQYLAQVRLAQLPDSIARRDSIARTDTSCIRWPEQGVLPARFVLAKLSKCFSNTVCDSATRKGP